jgi:hypothetical protein
MTDTMKQPGLLPPPRVERRVPHGQMTLDLVRRAPPAAPPRPAVPLPVPALAEELP